MAKTDKEKVKDFRAMLLKEAQLAEKEEKERNMPAKKGSGDFKKVAICGTAETLSMAPYEDKSWEIWGCATCLQHPDSFKRGTLLFEMHTPERWEHRIEQINKSGLPVLMQKKYKEIPKSKPFPVQEIWEFEPRWKRLNYVSNSISWMFMYAIMKGYQHIACFGVHMATDSEWWYERPNCEFYMAWAMAKGIDVFMPSESELLKFPRLYGYENPSDHLMIIKQRLKNYEQERQKHADLVSKNRDAMNQYIGAREAMKLMEKVLGK